MEDKKLKYKKNKSSSTSGFTLIELIVVVGIFVIITTVLLVNYTKFNSDIVLQNVAHHIALSVRQAQTYGLSVKGFGTGAGAVFPGYGIYFNTTLPREFYLFADTDGDKHMLGNPVGCVTGVDECSEKITIKSSEYIYAICGNLKNDGVPAFSTIDDVSGVLNCSVMDALHAVFTRPDPDAELSGYITGTGYESYSDAEIVIASPNRDVRTIVVWSTGQISVE